MGSEETRQEPSFKENFELLRSKAEEIQQMSSGEQIPDVDRLVVSLEQATKAYQVCLDRIQRAEQAVQQLMPETPSQEGEGGEQASDESGTGSDASDDEGLSF